MYICYRITFSEVIVLARPILQAWWRIYALVFRESEASGRLRRWQTPSAPSLCTSTWAFQSHGTGDLGHRTMVAV